MYSPTQSISIKRLNAQSQLSDADDLVIVEQPLEIICRQFTSDMSTEQFTLATTMRTPGDDIALVKGWLLTNLAWPDLSSVNRVMHTGSSALKYNESNKIVVEMKQNHSLAVDTVSRQGYQTSSCGLCGLLDIDEVMKRHSRPAHSQPMRLPDGQTLAKIVSEVATKQVLYQQTGACHSVALFDQQGKVLDVKEDVGRHNAMDKIIGSHWQQMQSAGLGLWVSGRVSFDLMQKAVWAQVTIVVSVGAPSSLAIELAKECDVCLIGFLKNKEANVYT